MQNDSSNAWTLSARWVFPGDAPPLEHGIVRIHDDRIAAVERFAGQSVDVDLGNAAIVPGFINCHTHLDLSDLRGKAPPSPDFTAWLRTIIEHRRQQSPEEAIAAIHAGLQESLQHGTTLLGDISAGGRSWTNVQSAPIRTIVFAELIGLTEQRAADARDFADRWLAEHPSTDHCRAGLSPHAPYSIRASLFEWVAKLESPVPIAIHLAETVAEDELLRFRKGPFVEFLQHVGAWDPAGLVTSHDELLEIFDRRRPLLVHANYLPLTSSIPAGATIIYCPRTHHAFGHTAHPVREWLQRGIRIAIGTDSLASNPDLSVLAELRFLHQLRPELSGEQLLHMGTLAGAEALGWEQETGSLTPGKSADLVVVPLPETDDSDPYRLLFESDLDVRRVLYRGRWRDEDTGWTPPRI